MHIGGVIIDVCGGEGVCIDRACMWARMIVAPRGAVKGRGWLVWRVVEDIHRAFLMFSAQFSDEGEISGPIEGPLDLEDEIRENECGGVSCVIITVGLNSDK